MSKNIIIIFILIIGVALGAYVVVQYQKSDDGLSTGVQLEENAEDKLGAPEDILENIVEIPFKVADYTGRKDTANYRPSYHVFYAGRVVIRGKYSSYPEGPGSQLLYLQADETDREKLNPGIEGVSYGSGAFMDQEVVWELLNLGDTPKNCSFSGEVTVIADRYSVLNGEVGGWHVIGIEKVLSSTVPEIGFCLDWELLQY